MKAKTIIGLAAIFVASNLFSTAVIHATKPKHHYYANTAVVTEVDKANNLVTVEDCNGNVWQFTETEDWEFADTCSMLMDSKGTQDITDDEIIQVTYCSFEVF